MGILICSDNVFLCNADFSDFNRAFFSDEGSVEFFSRDHHYGVGLPSSAQKYSQSNSTNNDQNNGNDKENALHVGHPHAAGVWLGLFLVVVHSFTLNLRSRICVDIEAVDLLLGENVLALQLSAVGRFVVLARDLVERILVVHDSDLNYN